MNTTTQRAQQADATAQQADVTGQSVQAAQYGQSVQTGQHRLPAQAAQHSPALAADAPADALSAGGRTFPRDAAALAYLHRKDVRLAAVMDALGWVERAVIPDFFSAAVHSIVGQQISTAAQRTVWARLQEKVAMRPEAVLAAADAQVQSAGISFKKVQYIKSLAEKIVSGALDVASFAQLSDAELVRVLVQLDGIGQWTAEMLLLFCFCRPNVLSFGDFGIRRGLRMLYGHTTLPRERFDRYARRYSPYGSTASLYLWAIAGGALPHLRDKGS